MNDEKKTLAPRGLWLAISFLIPIVGVILGLTYRRKEWPESKDFGKATMTAAILGVVTCVVLYVIWFVVLGAAGLLK